MRDFPGFQTWTGCQEKGRGGDPAAISWQVQVYGCQEPFTAELMLAQARTDFPAARRIRVYSLGVEGDTPIDAPAGEWRRASVTIDF